MRVISKEELRVDPIARLFEAVQEGGLLVDDGDGRPLQLVPQVGPEELPTTVEALRAEIDRRP